MRERSVPSGHVAVNARHPEPHPAPPEAALPLTAARTVVTVVRPYRKVLDSADPSQIVAFTARVDDRDGLRIGGLAVPIDHRSE
jgi:hypothetical protein